MDVPPGSPADKTSHRAFCVLLTPPETAPDERLMLLLESRGWRTRVVDDPLLAMSELCLIERVQTSKANAGGEAYSVRLVLQEIDEASYAPLVAAVQRYVPTATTGLFDGKKLERLGDFTAPTALTAPPPPSAPAAPSATSPLEREPREIAGVRHVRLTDDVPPPPSDEDDGRRITAEEIALLFAAEPPGRSPS